jgi:small ligand-binding sensory domain FIST
MMSKDDQTGAVTVPTEVSQNETIYMTRRDFDLVVRGVDRLGSQIKQQIGAKRPKLVLQFECAGRGKLFMREEQQSALLKSLHESIGSDVPWLGFYTFAEIGPLAGINHVHNYTCVVAAIY